MRIPCRKIGGGGDYAIPYYTTAAVTANAGLDINGLTIGKKYLLVTQALSTNSSHAQAGGVLNGITNATYEVIHAATLKKGESTSVLYETIVSFVPSADSIHVSFQSYTVASVHGFIIGN